MRKKMIMRMINERDVADVDKCETGDRYPNEEKGTSDAIAIIRQCLGYEVHEGR